MGRPRLNRDTHGYSPRMEPQLHEDIVAQAEAGDLSVGGVIAAALAAALDYSSPYLPTLDINPFDAPQLQEYVHDLLRPEHGDIRPGTRSIRASFVVDAALADLVDEECERVGMDYSSFIRAVLRVGLGHPIDSTDWPAQGRLELEGVAS